MLVTHTDTTRCLNNYWKDCHMYSLKMIIILMVTRWWTLWTVVTRWPFLLSQPSGQNINLKSNHYSKWSRQMIVRFTERIHAPQRTSGSFSHDVTSPPSSEKFILDHYLWRQNNQWPDCCRMWMFMVSRGKTLKNTLPAFQWPCQNVYNVLKNVEGHKWFQ